MFETISKGKAWNSRMKMPNVRLVKDAKFTRPVKEDVWHEVSAKRFTDPVTGQDAIVFTQTDIS